MPSESRESTGDRKKLYPDLNETEYRALIYFMNNISVGEILAIRELESIVGIKDPRAVIDSLIAKGYIERGAGCFNLSRRKFPHK
ncbi:MAG: helix-turn-helix domain-containing protein [Fervidicoccaceae archaeon]